MERREKDALNFKSSRYLSKKYTPRSTTRRRRDRYNEERRKNIGGISKRQGIAARREALIYNDNYEIGESSVEDNSGVNKPLTPSQDSLGNSKERHEQKLIEVRENFNSQVNSRSKNFKDSMEKRVLKERKEGNGNDEDKQAVRWSLSSLENSADTKSAMTMAAVVVTKLRDGESFIFDNERKVPSQRKENLESKEFFFKGLTQNHRSAYKDLIALASRAREVGIPIEEKAEIVIKLLKNREIGNILAAPLIDHQTKITMRKIEAKRREEKTRQFNQRRKEMEQQRVENIIAKSGTLRQTRLRDMASRERKKLKQTEIAKLLVVLASRLEVMRSALTGFRATVERDRRQDRAAQIITGALRSYCRRKIRTKIYWATNVLSLFFVSKIKRWRSRRRREASNIIVEFLESLQTINTFCGCISLITKGNQWSAYKNKVILVQRKWREKWLFIQAQKKAVDAQWKRSDEKNLSREVDRLYQMSEQSVAKENNLIIAANRTRRTLKMKPISRIKKDSKENIRKRLLEADRNELLSEFRRVPLEIRYSIIHAYLRSIKKLHMKDVQLYWEKQKIYEEEKEFRSKKEAFMSRYGGQYRRISISQSKLDTKKALHRRKSEVCVRRRSSLLARSLSMPISSEFDKYVEPVKPILKIFLDTQSLELMLKLGKDYVQQVKVLWDPTTVFSNYRGGFFTEKIDLEEELPSFEDIGMQIAKCNYH